MDNSKLDIGHALGWSTAVFESLAPWVDELYTPSRGNWSILGCRPSGDAAAGSQHAFLRVRVEKHLGKSPTTETLQSCSSYARAGRTVVSPRLFE